MGDVKGFGLSKKKLNRYTMNLLAKWMQKGLCLDEYHSTKEDFDECNSMLFELYMTLPEKIIIAMQNCIINSMGFLELLNCIREYNGQNILSVNRAMRHIRGGKRIK